MAEDIEKGIIPYQVSKGMRIAFNSRYIINPSQRMDRLRCVPKADTVKAWEIIGNETIIETISGTCLKIPNAARVQRLIRKKIDLDQLKPQTITPGATFNGVSIE